MALWVGFVENLFDTQCCEVCRFTLTTGVMASYWPAKNKRRLAQNKAVSKRRRDKQTPNETPVGRTERLEKNRVASKRLRANESSVECELRLAQDRAA